MALVGGEKQTMSADRKATTLPLPALAGVSGPGGGARKAATARRPAAPKRVAIDVDPSDIDPVDRLFVRIMLLAESTSAIDTILKSVDASFYARRASISAAGRVRLNGKRGGGDARWRRVYAIFAPYDARDGDELVPKTPVKSINRLERSVASLWKTRKLREIAIDATSHVAYASLENKFHDPDILIGVLSWATWGKVLCIDHPTFRMAG